MFNTAYAADFTVSREPILVRLARAIYQWQDRAAQRHALAELDDRLLQDIGIDRASAKSEAAKPFWRP